MTIASGHASMATSFPIKSSNKVKNVYVRDAGRHSANKKGSNLALSERSVRSMMCHLPAQGPSSVTVSLPGSFFSSRFSL